MKGASFTISIATAYSVIGLGGAQPAAGGTFAVEAPISVADIIGMTRLADPAYISGSSSCGRVAAFSRDNARFVVVLRRGLIEDDSNEYRVLLWETSNDADWHGPKTLLVWSSLSNRPAIEAVSWAGDDRSIRFLGEQADRLHQLYSLDIATLVIRQLTHSLTNVLSYSASTDGNVILYVAERRATNASSELEVRQRGLIVSEESAADILSDFESSGQTGETGPQLFVQEGTSAPRLLRGVSAINNPSSGGPALSPDGRYAVALAKTRFESRWRSYGDPQTKSMEEDDWALQYQLIDIQSGSVRALVDAPLKTWTFPRSPLWSPEGDSVVVTDTYLPLKTVVGTADRGTPTASAFAAEISVPDGAVRVITSEPLTLARWDERTGDIIFVREDAAHQGRSICPTVAFHRQKNVWAPATPAPGGRGMPELVLEEHMNVPPRLLIAAAGTGQQSVLLDLNPQLKRRLLAREEIFQWHTSDGHDLIGGLYFPIHFAPGKRYPLVIQTHAFTPERFWMDGPWSTAFAGQALAARGIMVLQTYSFPEATYSDEWRTYAADFGTRKEIGREVAAYEGAIDALDGKGLIDRARVGVIGFSRTCLYVKYALTHSTYNIAAASVTDGLDGGYFQYISFPRSQPTIEALFGQPPFGDGLRQWLSESPGFLVHKVHAPVRIVAVNPRSSLGEWEWFAGLSRLAKPVEMVVISDGVHELQKPWDRLISQGGNVDWFDFWLNGHEDPAAEKAEQYRRWEKLCDMQVEQNPKQPAFCVRSKAQ